MMRDNRLSADCIDVEEIGGVLELPAGHPSRRHAESCPRCRSLAASYVSFVAAEPVVATPALPMCRGPILVCERSRCGLVSKKGTCNWLRQRFPRFSGHHGAALLRTNG